MSSAVGCPCANFNGVCFECGTRRATHHDVLNPQNKQHECVCRLCHAYLSVADEHSHGGVPSLYDGC